MRVSPFRMFALFAGASVAVAASIPGDARLGHKVFREQKCVSCHSIRGEGGKSAPDLGARTAKSYSPSIMTSLMWNHAPAMWQSMEGAGVAKPAMSEDDAANLFAFFFANRFFEQPGDAGRGKKLLTDKRCEGCHGSSGPGKPVSNWTAADPIDLARQMWNHAQQMKEALKTRSRSWPALTPQDFADLQVYLQSQPTGRAAEPAFQPGPSETGGMLFKGKGCADCHKGARSLESKFKSKTLEGLAAAMWNHASFMTQTNELRPEEMRRIVGYLWSIQYFEAPGDAGKGKRVFEKKQCATCHGAASGGAPSLASLAGKANSMSMVSSLWKHGPDMLKAMNQKKVSWPRFEGRQMADLIAYLDSGK